MTARVSSDTEHAAFYRELVLRNRGIVTDVEQRHLRGATVLVAGCGSVGGAAVEPLVRIGVEHLRLAEPDGYDLANLNRQRATLADVGANKAAVLGSRALAINPFARVEVEPTGVTPRTVTGLVAGAHAVLDGVDVTTREAVVAKLALHREAARLRVPVVSGYDVAGRQTVLVYDYRSGRVPPLRGALDEPQVPLDPLRFLARVVPVQAIPAEIVPELRAMAAGRAAGFPQVVYTADLFGALATRAVVELVAGRAVRDRVVVDVHQLLRPRGARIRSSLLRARELLRLRRDLLDARRDEELRPRLGGAAPRHRAG